jgi:hypothetical protein
VGPVSLSIVSGSVVANGGIVLGNFNVDEFGVGYADTCP